MAGGTVDSAIGVAAWGAASSHPLARAVTRRLAFAGVTCAIVSSQAHYQPGCFAPFAPVPLAVA